MIRTLHRTRGASVFGATAPGQPGPFGTWPDPGEDDLDDGQDDEQSDAQNRSATGQRPPVAATGSRVG